MWMGSERAFIIWTTNLHSAFKNLRYSYNYGKRCHWITFMIGDEVMTFINYGDKYFILIHWKHQCSKTVQTNKISNLSTVLDWDNAMVAHLHHKQEIESWSLGRSILINTKCISTLFYLLLMSHNRQMQSAQQISRSS